MYDKLITHNYMIFIDPLLLPNELFDYLDGNGVKFIEETEMNKIRMEIIEKPASRIRGMRAKTIIYDELPF